MKYTPGEHDDELRGLHARGLTDSQMSAVTGLSRASICQRRHKLGLAANYEKRGPKLAYEGEPKPPEQKPNPVEAAKVALGTRITERNGAYWLDGRRPIRIKEMIEEANRVREKRGLRPIVMKERP